MQPKGTPPTESRRTRVERVFDEQGWDNIDLDQWEGDELEDLRGLMTDEQFQALVDALAESDDHEH